jgi:hypothetical protein
MISVNDIGYVLSGGSNNVDPALSTGGDPSGYPIAGNFNNLYDNIVTEEATTGLIDYRCIYIFNNNGNSSLYNPELYMTQVAEGSTIKIGTLLVTENQKIIILGTPTSGSFTITYDTESAIINYNADSSVFATNLQNGLNTLGDLSGVEVTVTATPTFYFSVMFKGDDNYRSHSLLEVVNNLVGATSITVTRMAYGSPINSIAPSLPTDLVPPTNVYFYEYSSESPIYLKTLKPGDGLPVWIQRTTLAGVEGLDLDGFTIALKGYC